MREIKFRAWDFKDKQWWDNYATSNMLDMTTVSGVVLQQYTGLKDKNGVEIYEGDILQNGTERVVVCWDHESAGYWLEFDGGDQAVGWNQGVARACEVIGNIYENGDLIS